LNERVPYGSDNAGDDGGFDASEEPTAVSDTASFHVVRLAQAIVAHGHAGSRFGEALGGIGLDLRWTGEPGKRVMFLVAAQDKVKQARAAFAGILERLDDIDRLLENEANELHLEENGP
jgi:hypothetical protein